MDFKNNLKEELSNSIAKDLKNKQADYSKKKKASICADLLHAIGVKVKEEGLNIVTLLEEEGIKKPTKIDISGRFVTELIKLSKECNHPLDNLNGRTCYYNGRYWEAIQEDRLANFFSKAADLMGVGRYVAIYPDFIRKAVESFRIATIKTADKPKGKILLNCNTTTLEISKSGEITKREHNPDDCFLYALPYDYSPNADCPMFKKFLNEVLPFYKEDILNLQEFCGSLLAPDMNHHKLAYLYGAKGRNGKSTFVEIITQALGADNVSSESLSSLTDTNSTGHASRAALEGKLLNTCGEIAHKINGSDIFKTLTAREAISVRPPYQKQTRIIEAHSYARLMFCCNDLPIFTQGAADAEARRFQFIGFDYQIPEDKVNMNLANDIIETELAGILNWLLEGLKRLLANGGNFTENPHAKDILSQFLEGSNSAFAYLNEYGIKAATPANIARYPNGHVIQVKKTDLYNGLQTPVADGIEESYKLYCQNNGKKNMMGRNKFILELKRQYFEIVRKKNDGEFFKLLIVENTDTDKEPQLEL